MKPRERKWRGNLARQMQLDMNVRTGRGFQSLAVNVSKRSSQPPNNKTCLYLQKLRELESQPQDLKHISDYWKAIDSFRLTPDQRVEALITLAKAIEFGQVSPDGEIRKLSGHARQFVNERIQEWAIGMLRYPSPKLTDEQLMGMLKVATILKKNPGPIFMGFWKEKAAQRAGTWTPADRLTITNANRNFGLEIPPSIIGETHHSGKAHTSSETKPAPPTARGGLGVFFVANLYI